MSGFLAILTMAVALFILSASGCAPFRPADRGLRPVGMPERYELFDQEGLDVPGPWWENLGNPELDRLIRQGLDESFDIRQARARLDQALALAAKAEADLYPALNLEGSSSHTRQKTGDPGENQERYSTTRSNRLGMAASYEIDLWGRVRSLDRAGTLTANATLEDVRAAAVTLSGKIAETWVNILLVRERLDVAWRQLETNEHILKLLRFRFVNSLATALDVLQQEETVAGSQAVLPGLKARERALLNELAVLMGRMPGQVAVETRTLPAVPAVPDTGLPADLLAARPDVRAAGLRLQASDWSVAAARADRLPALRLTARGEFFAEQVPNLFDNWLANLAGSVTGPIFDAGRREAEVERTRAVVRERLAAYEAVVARAIQEVQDALATGYFQGLEVQALDRQLAAARKSNRQASFRYQNGLIEYNVVLTELLNVQRLEQSVVQARADLLLERIRLGRALGGAWTLELDEPGPEAPSTQRSIHG